MTEQALRGGGLVLAAGVGRRFGSDKRRARLASGDTLIETTLTRWLQALPVVRAVLRAATEPTERELAASLHVRFPDLAITHAAHWAEGMGASLAAGIADCQDWDYVVIGLGDMPALQEATIHAIAVELEERCRSGEVDAVVRPRHDDRPGHPVGFGKGHFRALLNSSGDIGARRVVSAHAHVIDLPCSDPGIHRDIDTPDQLQL